VVLRPLTNVFFKVVFKNPPFGSTFLFVNYFPYVLWKVLGFITNFIYSFNLGRWGVLPHHNFIYMVENKMKIPTLCPLVYAVHQTLSWVGLKSVTQIKTFVIRYRRRSNAQISKILIKF
jgi:hypothetical protein